MIRQQVVVLRESHPVDVLHDECQGTNVPKCPVILSVEKVDVVRIVAPARLAVALAGVAASYDLSLREPPNSANIAAVHDTRARNPLVKLTRRLAFLVGPDGLDASSAQPQVTAAAAREERNS